MKTRSPLPVLLMLLAACAGTSTRQNLQLPALVGVWAKIAPSVMRADPSLGAAAQQATEALGLGDPLRIAAVPWQALLGAAGDDIERRLEAKEIGPLVAESLRGRLNDFSSSIDLYLRKP